MVRLLALFIVIAAAFVFGGNTAFAQSNLERAKMELAAIDARARVLEAQQDVGRCRAAVGLQSPTVATYENTAPLPALPVPQIMTDGGMVQAPNPRPLESFPVARPQSVAKPQQIAKPIPAIKAPPVVTEKGKTETPSPRPTADFPVAKPQQKTPAIEISRQERPEQRPAVGVAINKTDIKVIVNPPAFESGDDKKIATKIRPGELLLMERKYGIWKAETKKTNEIPQGYTLREGKESGS